MPKNKEYALYKGENLLHIGTIAEIAEKEEVKKESIKYFMTTTYRKRRKNSKTGNFRSLVCLD